MHEWGKKFLKWFLWKNKFAVADDVVNLSDFYVYSYFLVDDLIKI